MIAYLQATPGVRDVVVSGGDVANLPWPRLEAFVSALLDVDSIRDIRLASKALMGLPQHWLAMRSGPGMERLGGQGPASAGSASRSTRTSTRPSR